ncbi:phosphotransferase enzyme family protein [Neobacillus sp. D3-1R]|uniref:phosphotransferase enzyme family protein n=1 Tax=Neobacillus sp. D3-1R TaxID=3445778 RepID=UPI003FA0DF8C
MEQMLKKALYAYSIGNDSLIIEMVLHQNSWHKDLHFKIKVNGLSYSARFMPYNRSQNEVFGHISDEVLYEQIQFCEHLISHDIPFMRLVYTNENKPFVFLKWNKETYRFLLFEWIEGTHIVNISENSAMNFGQYARKIHDISNTYHSAIFKKTSHLVGYTNFKEKLLDIIKTNQLTERSSKNLKQYIELTQYHLEKGKTTDLDYIIQSDLNPLNILWDEQNKVIGIVDFESIGYSDRIEGLAWLIKWYSRTNGIHSRKMSSDVARAFLNAYNHDSFLKDLDFDRLSSLIWLSGCMNWNFLQKTTKLLESNSDEKELEAHLDDYLKRGESLLNLINNPVS